jgi:hypothetical protein
MLFQTHNLNIGGFYYNTLSIGFICFENMHEKVVEVSTCRQFTGDKKDIKIVKTKYIGKFMGISNMSVI